MLVEHYESQILLPDGSTDASFSPYWDPALTFDKKKRLDFTLRLHRAGLVKLRKTPRSFIGTFFAKHKTPDATRMVLDCRGTNGLHQPPPTTRLRSARCYGDLDLAGLTSEQGWGIEADVNDAFSNFLIPELIHYYTFNHPLDAATWSALGFFAGEVYDPDVRREVCVDPEEILFPCLFRWVDHGPFFYVMKQFSTFASRMHLRLAVFSGNGRPLLSCQCTGHLWVFYVGNITTVGSSFEDVQTRAQHVAESFKNADIPLTWSQSVPVKSLEPVGCVLDFEKKVLINKPKRVWKFFLATCAAKKVKGNSLQIWAGHYTSLCALAPCGLSCLEHTIPVH